MYQHPSTVLSFVRKPPPSMQQLSMMPSIHNDSQNDGMSYMMERPPNRSTQPSLLRAWMPNDRRQQDRCESVMPSEVNEYSGHDRLKQRKIKSKIDKFQCPSKLKIFAVASLLLLNCAAIGMSTYALVNSVINTMQTTNTTYISTITTTTTTTTTAILPSQCTTAVVINDPTRLTTAAGSTGTDTTFAASYVWYRFASPGGTQLATSPPAYLRCGGYYSGWYANALPTYSNTVFGTVCFVSNTAICAYQTSIFVTNCGSYYVYALYRTPITYSRYCTV